RWANLGAGTITSNLKNTYGRVRLDVAGTPLETGLQLLGSLIGDHAKTAIGTLLATGTVVGTGANVFEAVRPPKYVPPFAWGARGGGRTTPSSGATSRSSCSRGRAGRRTRASGCCARHAPPAHCSTPTSSPSTTWAKRTGSCSSPWSWSTGVT